jgi:hypothetical protein
MQELKIRWGSFGEVLGKFEGKKERNRKEIGKK